MTDTQFSKLGSLANSAAAHWSSTLLAVLIMIPLIWSNNVVERNDSPGYVSFAEAISTGALFQQQDINDVSYERAVRTPGFPAVIAVASAVISDTNTSVMVAHTAIAAITIVSLCFLLSPQLPALVTGLLVVGIQFANAKYANTIMTEWLAINLLLLIAGFAISTLHAPRTAKLIALGLLASAATLVKPSLLPTLLIAPFLWWVSTDRQLRTGALCVLTTAPVVLWMALNLIYLGSFSLALLNGQNLYGIATMIGHAEEQAGDSDELRAFLTHVNTKKIPAAGTEAEFMADLDNRYNRMIFINNVFWVAYNYKPDDMGPVTFDRNYLEVYAQRVITANPGNYIRYVLQGFKVGAQFGRIPYSALLVVLIPLYCAVRRKILPLAYTALGMFAVHVAQIGIAAGYQAVAERFIAVTYYPYMFTVLACCAALALHYSLAYVEKARLLDR